MHQQKNLARSIRLQSTPLDDTVLKQGSGSGSKCHQRLTCFRSKSQGRKTQFLLQNLQCLFHRYIYCTSTNACNVHVICKSYCTIGDKVASLFFISYFYDYSHHFSGYWCYFNTLTIVWYFSLSNFFFQSWEISLFCGF